MCAKQGSLFVVISLEGDQLWYPRESNLKDHESGGCIQVDLGIDRATAWMEFSTWTSQITPNHMFTKLLLIHFLRGKPTSQCYCSEQAMENTRWSISEHRLPLNYFNWVFHAPSNRSKLKWQNPSYRTVARNHFLPKAYRTIKYPTIFSVASPVVEGKAIYTGTHILRWEARKFLYLQ